MHNDKELYSLDSEKNPVKVQKIEKIPYSGKIYDVDVSNDIVLVRKKGRAIWSGNSNTKRGWTSPGTGITVPALII